MEKGRESNALAEIERQDLLREGRAVLRALGRRRLARDFCRGAKKTLTREELAELLLSFLAVGRSR